MKNGENGVRTQVYRAPKAHAVAGLRDQVAPRRRGPNGYAPSLAAWILRRPLLSKPRWKPKRQKQFIANDRRSRSSRTPGSKNDVDSGNFDAGESEDIDGSYLGLPQLQHHPVVQHTAQDRAAPLRPRLRQTMSPLGPFKPKMGRRGFYASATLIAAPSC